MKKIYTILISALLSTLSNAESTTLKLSYENLNFENSKMKDNGKRFGFLLNYHKEDSLYQIAYDKTNTNTYKPPLTEDLHVNKYYLKYSQKLDNKQSFSISYATIDDNIMIETDGGHIYGLGYKYGPFGLTQYLSDYKNFNVFQTEVKYTFKKEFGELKSFTTLMGKYIHLQDKNSNIFSVNAKENYFTPGIKFHAHYKDYHIGAAAFFGKRIFSVMNDGFAIQHHAMEFNETYMFGIGKHLERVDLNLKYVYQKATEIPINNENVKANNIILQVGYHF